jgi:hypothetical protein
MFVSDRGKGSDGLRHVRPVGNDDINVDHRLRRQASTAVLPTCSTATANSATACQM